MPSESSSLVYRIRYRLTRLGVHFVFVAAFTMIGGALRGFNLLLVLAGLLIGALLVQWRVSRFAIHATSARRILPPEAFAGAPFRIRYQLRNISRFLPVWMIRIDDEIELPGEGEPYTVSSGVGVIGPNSQATTHCDCLIGSRGRYRIGPLTHSTLFPFSLLHTHRTLESYGQMYVFPLLLSLRKGWQQTLMTQQGGTAAAARRSGPHEGDFFGLREWQTGDNPRWIHHRTTARVGEPIVRQFEQQRQFDACLLVDCFFTGRHRPVATNAVEIALSFAATIVTSMDRAPANRLVLAVADSDPNAVPGGRIRNSQRRMLEILAEAAPTTDVKLTAAIDAAVIAAGYAKDLVVISPRDMHAALDDDVDGELRSRLQSWQRRGGLRWINVQSREFKNFLVTGSAGHPASNTESSQERHDVRVA